MLRRRVLLLRIEAYLMRCVRCVNISETPLPHALRPAAQTFLKLPYLMRVLLRIARELRSKPDHGAANLARTDHPTVACPGGENVGDRTKIIACHGPRACHDRACHHRSRKPRSRIPPHVACLTFFHDNHRQADEQKNRWAAVSSFKILCREINKRPQ